MGNQKLKWTADEEETLLAGVKKHGPGKWKNILRDPDFAEKLSNRSNIDLKDKWRNLSVAPGIQGSKDKIRTPKIKAEAFALSNINPTPSPKPSPVVPPPRYESNNDDYINPDPKNAPRYDGMIFEALTALADDNGSDVGAIFNFIEQQRHEVPSNFRRILSSRLRRLAAQCKLVKTQNFYKMNDNSLGTRTPIAVRVKEINVKPQKISNQGPVVSPERVSEASVTAAYKLVEVENKLDVVKGAVEEIERMTILADQADVILMLAMEINEQCSQGMIVELA